LDAVGALPLLSFLFSLVLLPKAVREELFRRRETEDRFGILLRELAFIVPCDDYDQAELDILFTGRSVRGTKDRGEAESIAQASKKGASVIIDDMWGRKQARRHGLDLGGSITILRAFYDLRLRSGPELRANFVVLRQRGIRLPWKTVNATLQAIGQEPLTANELAQSPATRRTP